MRLRSRRDTVQLSVQEVLTDFDPYTLDEPFDWVVESGSCVWVNDPCLGWRRGIVLWQSETVFDRLSQEPIYQWTVQYDYKKNKGQKQGDFQPSRGNMKPDTPAVHELLRRKGIHTPLP